MLNVFLLREECLHCFSFFINLRTSAAVYQLSRKNSRMAIPFKLIKTCKKITLDWKIRNLQSQEIAVK